jgi:predicted lipoprotein with Yx(FWY)xxD motif
MIRSRLALRAAAAAAFLVAIGCAAAPAGPGKVVDGALVTPAGNTLYVFDKDAPASGKSACNGPCATAWPPLAAAASDTAQAPWSIVTRDDGSRQWAYDGKPVYTFQKDEKPGDRTGDNFKGVWHVLKP